MYTYDDFSHMTTNIYTHSYWQSRRSDSPVRLRTLAMTDEVFELYNDSGHRKYVHFSMLKTWMSGRESPMERNY